MQNTKDELEYHTRHELRRVKYARRLMSQTDSVIQLERYMEHY